MRAVAFAGAGDRGSMAFGYPQRLIPKFFLPFQPPDFSVQQNFLSVSEILKKIA